MSTPRADNRSCRLCANSWVSTTVVRAFKGKEVSSLRSPLVVKFIQEKWSSSFPLQIVKAMFYLQLQILPEGLRVNVLDAVFSCGSAHSLCGMVIWCHLIILHTSISIWRLVQCLTLRPYSGLHYKIGSVTFLLLISIQCKLYRGIFAVGGQAFPKHNTFI